MYAKHNKATAQHVSIKHSKNAVHARSASSFVGNLGRTEKRSYAILAIIATIALAASVVGIISLTQKSALAADSNTSNLSMSELIGTVDEQNKTTTFNEAQITNNATTDFVIETTKITKFEGVNDDNCSWTLKGDDIVLYDGKAATSSEEESPYIAEDVVVIPANGGTINIQFSQTGLSFDSAKSLVDQDVLKIELNAAQKATDEEKQTAKDNVDKAAATAIDSIKAFEDLTQDQIDELVSNVEDAQEVAKDLIDDTASLPAINTEVELFKASMDDIQSQALELAKNGAKEFVDNSVKDAKDNLATLSLLTDEQKQTYEKQIADAESAAKTAINAATDNAGIQKAKEDLVKILADIKANSEAANKETAKTIIDTKANEEKAKIDNLTGLTENDKEALKNMVDKDATTAKTAIDTATSGSAVDEAVEAGNLAIVKEGLEASLASELNIAKDKIAECKNLKKEGEGGIDARITEITKKEIEASNKVRAAESVEEAQAEANKGSAAIQNGLKDAQEANSTSYWTVTFDVNGTGTAIEPITDTYQYGNKLTAPTAPTDPSSATVFAGWYTTATEQTTAWDFENNKVGDAPSVQNTCSLTLYAKWDTACKISGSVQAPNEGLTDYENVSGATVTFETDDEAENKVVSTATTDSSGSFTLKGITSGTKGKVKVAATNFCNYTSDDMTISTDVSLSGSLKVGRIQTLSVEAGGARLFLPAFADNTLKSTDVKFFWSNESGEEIVPADTTTGYYKMSDLVKYNEETEAYSYVAFYALCNIETQIHCYCTVPANWNSVFSIAGEGTSTTYPIDADSLQSSFASQYCVNGVDTIYTNNSSDSENWGKSRIQALGDKYPTVNGVKYYDFYNNYGISKLPYGIWPHSMCAQSLDYSYYATHKTDYSFDSWKCSDMNRSSSQGAVVLSRNFGNATVKYNENGGTGVAQSTKKYIVGTNITLSSGELTKEGYIQSGWNTKADGSGKHYDMGASYTVTSDVTFYAEWASSLSVTVNGTSTLFLPAFADDAYTTSQVKFYDKDAKEMSPKTSGATTWKMSDLYTDKNNHVAFYRIVDSSVQLHCYQTVDIAWSSVFNDIETGTAPGLLDTFKSSYLTGNAVKTVYFDDNNDTVATSIGNWDVNNTSATPTLSNVDYSNKDTDTTCWYGAYGGDSGMLSSWANFIIGSRSASSDNHYFLHTLKGYDPSWVTRENVYKSNTHAMILSRNFGNATITYDANGANSGSEPAAQTGLCGSTTTLAMNTGSLAKDGFAFAGWNTKADGSGTHYDPGDTSYTITGDVTLYAQWSNSLSVAYGGESGGTLRFYPAFADDSFSTADVLFYDEEGCFMTPADTTNNKYKMSDLCKKLSDGTVSAVFSYKKINSSLNLECFAASGKINWTDVFNEEESEEQHYATSLQTNFKNKYFSTDGAGVDDNYVRSVYFNDEGVRLSDGNWDYSNNDEPQVNSVNITKFYGCYEKADKNFISLWSSKVRNELAYCYVSGEDGGWNTEAKEMKGGGNTTLLTRPF